MQKKWILMILALLLMVGVGYAFTLVNLSKTYPTNQKWFTNTTGLWSGRDGLEGRDAGNCNHSFNGTYVGNETDVILDLWINGVLNESINNCTNATATSIACEITMDICVAFGNATTDNASVYKWDLSVNYSNSTEKFSTLPVTGNYTFGLDFENPIIVLDTPANNTYYTNNSAGGATSLNFSFKYTEMNPYICYLKADKDCGYTLANMTIAATNNSLVGTNSTGMLTATFYDVSGWEECNWTLWDVECIDQAGRSANASAPRTIVIDTEIPRIAGNRAVDLGIDTRTNNTWTNTKANNFTFTPYDSNLETCEFWLNSTGNQTSDHENSTGTLVINQRFLATIRTGLQGWNDTTLDDGAPYHYNIRCNDSAGNWGYLVGANASDDYWDFNIDATYPTDPNFNCQQPYNDSASNDLTPTFRWGPASDNLARLFDVTYEFFYKLIDDSTWNNVNITTNATYYTLTTDLPTNLTGEQYTWYVNATDSAGNSINATNCGLETQLFDYYPMGACHDLRAGWNICGWWNDSIITAGYLGNTSTSSLFGEATYISHYNSSHDFVTWVNSSTTNYYENFTQGEPIFIYTPSATTWDGNEMSNYSSPAYVNINFTNATSTSSGWNWISIMKVGSMFFKELEERVFVANFSDKSDELRKALDQDAQNVSLKYWSFYNNTDGLYHPFVANRTYNNETNVTFGDSIAIWSNFDGLNVNVTERTAQVF